MENATDAGQQDIEVMSVMLKIRNTIRIGSLTRKHQIGRIIGVVITAGEPTI